MMYFEITTEGMSLIVESNSDGKRCIKTVTEEVGMRVARELDMPVILFNGTATTDQLVGRQVRLHKCDPIWAEITKA